jgi:regulatory protein
MRGACYALRVSGYAVRNLHKGPKGRGQMTGNRGQMTEDREQGSEDRELKLGTRNQRRVTSDQKPVTRNQKPVTSDQQQKAMNTAVRVLARRDHTRLEIEQKLKQRGYDQEIIQAVVAECERLNYIDDERTAKVYIFQLARRGFGFRRIRLELLKKGLRGDRFEQIVKESRLEIDERKIASRALQKKMKSFEREEDSKKRKNKIYRFLYSRGFSQSVISELIRGFR